MADGKITFSTALDNSDLEKGLKQAEKRVEDLKKKIEADEDKKTLIEKQMERSEKAIHETEEEVARLKARLEELNRIAIEDPFSRDAATAEARQVSAQLKEAEKSYARQVAAHDKLNESWQQANDRVDLNNQKLETAKARAAELGTAYATAYKNGSVTFSNGMSAMEKRFAAFTSKITKRMKKLFVFSFIFGALAALKRYITDTVGENDRLAASMENLKAILRGFAAPAIAVLANVLTNIVNVISSMMMSLAKLVDSIFHTNIVQSIKASQDAARAAWNAGDATDAQADATNRLAKAQKEANRWLAAFDELNVQNADHSDGITDGLEDMAGGVGKPSWDGLDVGRLDDVLSEIMLVLGGALLAVGAILAFSGINIPLGITLMAVGALMIYTAAQEQWDKLPQEVQDAINGALIISGILLLVIGAVLAFSGVATPLGIGMMAAGAALLWTAVALNWESMPQEMRDVVALLMGILGAALLVVGALLAFTGAATPLGIGLMVLGAASLGGAVWLNWDTMPDEVKATVTTIMTILGGALLVIGAILALTGVALPLGVGLMLAGAVTLGAAAALNWDAMPQGVRDVVSTIMAIIGGALIVIGVILCVTGVGLPLGIALIVAGAGSLVAAVAINFNALKDKIAEIWDGIRSWWRNSVAQIFTTRWWADKFASIGKGLVDALSGAGSRFHNFIVDVCENIGGALSMLGQGWSYSIPAITVPYLAKGAVIPPNREFMAVLGDQRRGMNIEAPEDLIRQIVRDETGAQLASTLTTALMQVLPALNQGGGDAIMTLVVDGEELARATNRGNASLMRRGAVRPTMAFE